MELKEKQMGLSDKDLERMTTEGNYAIFVLCYSPDQPKGYVIVPVDIPNKKEYRRLIRQLFFVRMGLRKRLWFKNLNKDWQFINTGNNVILSVSPYCVESKVVKTPEGEKKIYVAR